MAEGKGLGKGLGSLFGDDFLEESAEKTVKGLRLSEIEPNAQQPRHDFDGEKLNELAESIRQHGVITPITVRKTGDTYQIIAGERRWRAARMAGLSEIPAMIMSADDEKVYELALIENLQRENLNPIEEAEGYFTLIERMGFTQAEAAERIGRSRPAITNSMRLLGLPEDVKKLVSDGKLSAGHGRALLGLENSKKIKDAANLVISRELSVRQTEELVKNMSKPEKVSRPKNEGLQMYIRNLEEEMSKETGHKIKIVHGKKRGKLTIEYYGNMDLDRVCSALKTIK